MIDDLELVAAPPAPSVGPRTGGPAWALAALIAGTVGAVDPAGFVPTGPLRCTVITAATGIALGAAVRRPVAIPRLMTGLWGALVGVMSIATLTAADPLHAWIGTPDRRLGLPWCTFPALLLAGHACMTRGEAGERSAHHSGRAKCGDERACDHVTGEARPVLRAGAFGALVLGVWSAAELLGHPPLGLEFAAARAGGPFGQPAYLGAACLLFGPLALATALDGREPRWWRRVGAFGAAGTLLALALSQTRAAWLGALVATVAIVVRKRVPLRRYRLGNRAAVVVALATIAVALSLTTPLGARAATTFDLGHGTSAGRVDEWRIAFRVIADRPFLGVGPEGYRVVFPEAVDASYVRRYGVAVYPDRAHNGILDVTLAGGVAAGLLYAALLALVLRHAWRALARSDPLDVALGAAVLAYVVQQQFLFPLAELDPMLWVLVGMLVARTSGPARRAVLRAGWLLAPVAIVTVVGLNYGARDVLADRALRRAARDPDARAALAQADHATRLRPDSIRAWYVAARVAQRGDALTDLDAALDRVVQGLDRSPKDPALRDLYGELLVERAARSGLVADIATARQELERLCAGAPHDPRLKDALVTARSLHEIGAP